MEPLCRREYTPARTRALDVASNPYLLECLTSLTDVSRRAQSQDVHTVITFTDSAHQGLASALNAFPCATKVSLSHTQDISFLSS